jgi:hypothetical protein
MRLPNVCSISGTSLSDGTIMPHFLGKSYQEFVNFRKFSSQRPVECFSTAGCGVFFLLFGG